MEKDKIDIEDLSYSLLYSLKKDFGVQITFNEVAEDGSVSEELSMSGKRIFNKIKEILTKNLENES